MGANSPITGEYVERYFIPLCAKGIVNNRGLQGVNPWYWARRPKRPDNHVPGSG
jgi:hypothetical protein